MPEEFREGDRVRHHSCPEPVRVVGVGTTIVVQFPNGDMQAFEPCELEKVSIASVPVRKVQVREYTQDGGLGTADWYVFLGCVVAFITLMLLMLVDTRLFVYLG